MRIVELCRVIKQRVDPQVAAEKQLKVLQATASAGGDCTVLSCRSEFIRQVAPRVIPAKSPQKSAKYANPNSSGPRVQMPVLNGFPSVSFILELLGLAARINASLSKA